MELKAIGITCKVVNDCYCSDFQNSQFIIILYNEGVLH